MQLSFFHSTGALTKRETTPKSILLRLS